LASFENRPDSTPVPRNQTSAGDRGGPDGCAFEDIFQIVIMILVESANGQNLLGTLELAMHHAVSTAVARLIRQAAVAPQLALGTEAMWRLDEREQERCANGADSRESGAATW
jgi:hypothetical protein